MPGRTLDIIREQAERCGFNPNPLVNRCRNGFDEYGSENHLMPEFRPWRETVEELADTFDIGGGMVIRRGDKEHGEKFLDLLRPAFEYAMKMAKEESA